MLIVLGLIKGHSPRLLRNLQKEKKTPQTFKKNPVSVTFFHNVAYDYDESCGTVVATASSACMLANAFSFFFLASNFLLCITLLFFFSVEFALQPLVLARVADSK